MAYERLKDAALPRTLAEVLADLSDLFQKELRLAKAEISAKIAAKLNAGVWMAVAGILVLLAAVFALEALIFVIASYGIGMPWACLIVAACLAAVALGAFLKGRADAQEGVAPARTIHQIRRDIATAKEQLT
jgi:uncharacterized integral membrane protein